ncbi:IS30 family transposase [Saccharicrinis aurantiacus]|uniref:IS30 family transposase n=1 Tax=Saccharicrinis aurantiacus TaxID=1849719 RepID=UPI0024908B6D|nr:IS30 family transposase [Saccharicrinis aurantiacus]
MNGKNYTRLTLKERCQIEGYLKDFKSVSEIARLLDRNRSTISRELKRGLYLTSKFYIADHAHKHADIRNRIKRLDPRLLNNNVLRFYVFRSLLKGWTPEQIANRVVKLYPNNLEMRISYEAIYCFIYKQTNFKLKSKLIKLLVHSKPKRSKSPKRKQYMGTIIDRTPIDERPIEVENRDIVGHWESDLIIGKGQQSAIGTIVERSSRYTLIIPLKSRKSEHVVREFTKALMQLPKHLLKSITHDNGIEMSAHKQLTKRTNMPVYFAHPYSSWERGTNENTNGLIRRVFKKKTDFNKVSPEALKELQNRLNDRPRKVLDYRTPNEILNKSCA